VSEKEIIDLEMFLNYLLKNGYPEKEVEAMSYKEAK
jgi:hypothetical protein|tara:strand:- start:560 stop:667 length:108 start_codon:yes stop_codon:yes gene_type:complete